ncbi:LAMI_0F04368g1_1 [Lachancea mirantina]|uniref:LAMI_0F04368g1_1 n=1 Tax=Lachancea mirantina TaxID=1230905 RepID=A0A1G4JXS2_9SACH|nr:LAMI_0F04368g1_1 [Lachancea mirantina]
MSLLTSGNVPQPGLLRPGEIVTSKKLKIPILCSLILYLAFASIFWQNSAPTNGANSAADGMTPDVVDKTLSNRPLNYLDDYISHRLPSDIVARADLLLLPQLDVDPPKDLAASLDLMAKTGKTECFDFESLQVEVKHAAQRRWKAEYVISLLYIWEVKKLGICNPMLPFSWYDWRALDVRCCDVETRRPPVDKIVFANVNSNAEVKVVNVAEHISGIFDTSFGLFNELRYYLNSTSSFCIEALESQLFRKSKHVYSTATTPESGWAPRQMMISESLRLPRIETRPSLSLGSSSSSIVVEPSDLKFDAERRIEQLSIETESKLYENRILVDRDFQFLEKLKQKHILALRNGKEDRYISAFFDTIETPKGSGAYDPRFFRQYIDATKRDTAFKAMTKAWQIFTENEQIISWHPTESILPAGELHTHSLEIPIRHFEYLSANFNGSLIVFRDQGKVHRYFLEIDPSYVNLNQNSIDARFIDADTGLSLQLKAVSQRALNQSLHAILQHLRQTFKWNSLKPLLLTKAIADKIGTRSSDSQ